MKALACRRQDGTILVGPPHDRARQGPAPRRAMPMLAFGLRLTTFDGNILPRVIVRTTMAPGCPVRLPHICMHTC